MQHARKREKEAVKNSYFILWFPLLIVYYEIVFRLSTTDSFFNFGLLPMLFFSVAYGLIGYLLSTIFKNRLINRIITHALTLILRPSNHDRRRR